MAAARGVAQGLGSQRQHTTGECVGELDDVLIELRLLMGQQAIPKVEEAKDWLRSVGGSMTARASGRLSSARNAQAHSLAKRVVADARRLTEKASISSVDGSLASGSEVGIGARSEDSPPSPRCAKHALTAEEVDPPTGVEFLTASTVKLQI